MVHDYEARESPEAQAVKDLDLLEMIVQLRRQLSQFGIFYMAI